ncbi:MAG TPA: hypothetical protein VF530_08540 [Planctomycetota bacterium]
MGTPSLLALASLVLASPVAAQGLPSPLPPSNPAPIVYLPPERLSQGAASPYHVLNVFLPRGIVPAQGWPVVLATGYGGGNSVPPLASLASTGQSKPLWDLVAAGIAVVHFGTPGIGNNRGLWYPPGHASGRWESYRPQHDNPEKSAVWALQWLKVQALHPFDLARIGLRGSSGGAVLAMRSAMGPERARASGSAHVRASTRVAAILAIQPPTSAWALEQGPELTIAFPKHLEQAAQPGVAATILQQVTPELQKDYSLMRECFASAEARGHNASQALCLVYGDPVLHVNGQPASFALDASGFPLLHDAIKQPLQHDSWFGYVFWKRLLALSPEAAAFHGANSVFAMRDLYALPPPDAVHTTVYSGTVKGVRATRIGHDWLVGRLLGRQASVARCAAPSPVPRQAQPLRLPGGSARPGRALSWTRAQAEGWELALEASPRATGWLLATLGSARPARAVRGQLLLDDARALAVARADAAGHLRFTWPDELGTEALQVLVLDPEAAPDERLRLSDVWRVQGPR